MHIPEVLCAMSLLGFFAEPIGSVSQLRSLSKVRFLEADMAERPKRLLEQVHDVLPA